MLASLSTGSRRLPLTQLISECPKQMDHLLRDLVRLDGNWRVRFSSHDENGTMPFTLHIAKMLDISKPSSSHNIFLLDVSSMGVTWTTMVDASNMNTYMFKSITDVIEKGIREKGIHNITELLVKHLCNKRLMASMTFEVDAHDAHAQKTLTDRFDAMIPHQYDYNRVRTVTRAHDRVTTTTATTGGVRKVPSAFKRNQLQKKIRNVDALSNLMASTTLKGKK